MPWSSLELFCHSFFNLLFAYFTITCLKKHWSKKKLKKKKPGVIFLLVIDFLSQMHSFPQMSAGVAASWEIRTPCTELDTQLPGGGHSIRLPRVSMWGGNGKLHRWTLRCLRPWRDVSTMTSASGEGGRRGRGRGGQGAGGGAGFTLGVPGRKRQRLPASDEELWAELSADRRN